jgi:hypothetical protein
MFPGNNVQDRGVFTRPFIFGLILLLLFLTATTEMGPPPQRPSSVTLTGSQSHQDDELKDEVHSRHCMHHHLGSHLTNVLVAAGVQAQRRKRTIRGSGPGVGGQPVIVSLTLRAAAQHENRKMRLHLLDLRKIVKECKGANFTTDLQRAYKLSDLKHLRGPSGKLHPHDSAALQRAAGEQQQQQHQQPPPLQPDTPAKLSKTLVDGTNMRPAYNDTSSTPV